MRRCGCRSIPSFPREDYERLIDAQEAGDADGVRIAGGQLEGAAAQARSICESTSRRRTPPISR
jgi:hypothetical protein